MTRLPHKRNAAMCLDIFKERLRAFDLGDDSRAWPTAEQLARVDHHQLITPKYAASLIDNADAVGVTIERDAEIASGLTNGRYQITEVFAYCWIGVVIWKCRVRISV